MCLKGHKPFLDLRNAQEKTPGHISNSFWQRKTYSFCNRKCVSRRCKIIATCQSHNCAQTKARDYIGGVCTTKVLQTPFWAHARSRDLSGSQNSSLSSQRVARVRRRCKREAGRRRGRSGNSALTAPRGRPGSLIRPKWSTAALQTKCHLVPVGDASSALMRWLSTLHICNNMANKKGLTIASVTLANGYSLR